MWSIWEEASVTCLSINEDVYVCLEIGLSCYRVLRVQETQGSRWNFQAEGQWRHKNPASQHPIKASVWASVWLEALCSKRKASVPC